jgi:cobalt-zinc-cadmium efflux system outer membrane protein
MKIFPLVLLSAWVSSVAAQPTVTNRIVLAPAFINELAEEMRTNNSALWAARARISAAQQNAKSIPLWRDPEVMIGGMAAERAMRAEDGDIIYGAEQMLPVFGKEKAVRKAAGADISVQEADLEYQFQTLRKGLSAALFEAALRDELLRLSEQDLLWLDTTVKGVEERYRVGDASQVDVLRVQNERSRRADQLVSDENRREDAYVSVNRILNRNAHAGWAALSLPEAGKAVPMSQKVVDFALKFEPKLKALRQELNKAEAIAESSKKEKRPDLALAVEARQYSGTGEARSGAALLKLKLPWFNKNKYDAALRRDEARVQELENQIEDYIHQTQAEVHHLTSMIDNARREALVYRDEIIPRSERALGSAQIAWQSSKDAFRDVLDSRRMLLEARTMYFKAVADQYKAISELVLCCGVGDLEALEMIDTETNGADWKKPRERKE